MQPSTDVPIRTIHHSPRGWEEQPARIIRESIVSLTVNGATWLSFTCTPTHLEELCVGFLFNDNIIKAADEVEVVKVCENGQNVDIWLNRSVERPSQWRRTSGCTGGVTTDGNHSVVTVKAIRRIYADQVMNGMEQLLHAQQLYRETRGVHCSAISDGTNLRLIAEDIGRHNTLDKLAGLWLKRKVDFQPEILFTTGRISSEMLEKSARLGVAVVVSRTSPTSLSIERAEESGITIIGYARRDQFTVYAHPERLVMDLSPELES